MSSGRFGSSPGPGYQAAGGGDLPPGELCLCGLARIRCELWSRGPLALFENVSPPDEEVVANTVPRVC